MSDKPQNEYLKSQIMTASPERLQMMLYDGAIRFCEQARQAMQAGDIPTTHDRMTRAQRIVLELSNGLRREMNPQLCDKLASLYNYVYRLLVDANFHRKVETLAEAMELLTYQRDTWQMLMEKLRQERAGQPLSADAPAEAVPSPAPTLAATATPSRPAARATSAPFVGGSLCLEG